MACRTGMTFPWLTESIRAAGRVLWVLRFHWLTVLCISQEYPVLHNAGRQQRALDWRQCCSHLHGPQIAFFALGQCHNRHSLIWDVRTHYSLIAGMSRTFICGTNGLRFKPQQSITPFFAFTPSKINVHLHLGLNLHQTPRILQKCFDLLWITYKLIIDWSDQGSSSGWWLTVYTIPFRFTENERTIPQQLTITSDRQLSMF